MRINVRLKPASVLRTLARVAGAKTAKDAAGAVAVRDVIPQSRVQQFEVPAGKAQEALDALRRHPEVELAELDGPVHAHGTSVPAANAMPVTPNDPLFGQQYALAKINASGAWGVASATSPLTIAIVDTGIFLTHPDLQGRLVSGATCSPTPCVAGAAAGNDDNGHGTHVAGIAAASGNNAAGIAGVALGTGVKLMPVKVLDAAGEGSFGTVAAGIHWAVDNGAKVINLSLGGSASSQTINTEIDYAYSHGVLVIISGGNCGGPNYAANGCSVENEWDYPAGYAATQPSKVIPVAATDQDDAHAAFSTVADYIRIGGVAAPGRSILSTGDPRLPVFGGTSSCLAEAPSYCRLSGTSMAAPHVAGLAALLWSANPALSVDALHSAILQSAADLGTTGADTTFGTGRIDALAAAYRGASPSVAATATAEAVQTSVAATATAAATATPTPTRTSTPTASPTGAAGATGTATATATATQTPSPTPTATGSPSPTTIPAPASAPASGGDSGGGGGGSSAPSAPATAPVRAGPVTPNSVAVAAVPSSFVAAPVAGGVEVRGTNGSVIRVESATVDMETGRRRYHSWLRSDSGPIFGLSLGGQLEWISPDDVQDIQEIDWAKVQTIPDEALTAVPLAAPRIGWLLWDFRGSGRIFVVGDDGALHHIPDMATFNAQFAWRNVLPVSAGQVAQLAVGAGLPPIG